MPWGQPKKKEENLLIEACGNIVSLLKQRRDLAGLPTLFLSLGLHKQKKKKKKKKKKKFTKTGRENQRDSMGYSCTREHWVV